MTVEEIMERTGDLPIVFLPHEYDDAIVGLAVDGVEAHKIIYSKQKFLEGLQREGMTEEEAIDWYEYNTVRSLPYMGEHAPIFME